MNRRVVVIATVLGVTSLLASPSAQLPDVATTVAAEATRAFAVDSVSTPGDGRPWQEHLRIACVGHDCPGDVGRRG